MFTVTLIAVALLWALLKYLKKDFDIFEKRGVKFEQPVIIFGNMMSAAMGKVNLVDLIQRL
jgi:uncharacterized membrane protein (DUF441 family)